MPAEDIRDLMHKLAHVEEARGNIKAAKEYRAMARYWNTRTPESVGRKPR